MKLSTRRWLFVLATVAWAPLAGAQARLVPAGSEILFVSKQMGVPVEGRFKRFDAQIDLDPKKPESGKVAFRVDLASVAFGAPEVEAEIAKPEWFDTKRFPQASFASTAVKATGPRRYEVTGKLSIKGVARDVTVPVTLAAAGADTAASGSFMLKRLEHRIGDGDWKDTSLVADEVEVRFKLVLAGVPPAVKALVLAGVCIAGTASAQVATYTIDPTHTSIVVEADANGLSTLRARLARQQGTITLDRAARTGRAEIGIDTTTASTGIAAIDAALQGKDLLDSAAHPAARFVAERFTFDGDRVTAVDGTLTLRGRERPVALKATHFGCYNNPLLRREVCGGDFETTLTRADLGIGSALPTLGETFKLLIQVEAIRQP